MSLLLDLAFDVKVPAAGSDSEFLWAACRGLVDYLKQHPQERPEPDEGPEPWETLYPELRKRPVREQYHDVADPQR
jgi:hypothetical protein